MPRCSGDGPCFAYLPRQKIFNLNKQHNNEDHCTHQHKILIPVDLLQFYYGIARIIYKDIHHTFLYVGHSETQRDPLAYLCPDVLYKDPELDDFHWEGT